MVSTVQELLAELPKRFDPEAWGSENAVLVFNVTGGQGGSWVARVQDGKLSVAEGTVDSPDMTMTVSDEDLLAMVNGDLNPVSAFMQGKVTIDGNVSLAMKLQSLLG